MNCEKEKNVVLYKQCTTDDRQGLIELQKKVNFTPVESKDIKALLEQKDIYFICAKRTDGICAYAFTIFNNKVKYVQPYFDNKRVAVFDTMVSLPEYHNSNLQQKLLEISCEEAVRRDYSIIAALISPDDFYGINNFITNGFKIKTIVCYDDKSYYIMYKDLMLCTNKDGMILCSTSTATVCTVMPIAN